MTRRAMGLLLLLEACASQKPKEVALAGGRYSVTVPRGWVAQESPMGSTADVVVTFEPQFFANDGSCVLAFLKANGQSAAEGLAQFTSVQKRGFDAKESTPKTLTTMHLGVLAGESYQGHVPPGGLNGVARFAGAMTVEVYAFVKDDSFVAVQIMTTNTSEHRERFREECERIVRTLSRSD